MVQYFNGLIDLDCGSNPQNFKENKIFEVFQILNLRIFREHMATSLIAKTTWDSVEGFSEEFSPGLGSDPDFNMKLWLKGVRIFKGLGNVEFIIFHQYLYVKRLGIMALKLFIEMGISIKFFKTLFKISKNL